MELFAIGIVVAIVAFGLWYQISKSETPAPAPVQAPTPKAPAPKQMQMITV